MRVSYQSAPSATREPVYRQTAVKFCCATLCQWWGVLIGFGCRGCQASTCRDVCLYLDRPQANGGIVLEVVPVEHCPWCGEAVETCRVK
jgi:hypothetical protein